MSDFDPTDPRRRASDDEAFKYSIVAEQARITTKVELLHDMVKLQLGDHTKRLEKLEDIVIGGANPGLVEKNRNVTKEVAKLFSYISIGGVIFWKLISPMYDAWVNRWIPQKIASAAEAQPAPKVSKIVRKAR